MVNVKDFPKLFVALRCVDRLHPFLNSSKIVIPTVIFDFIDSCWLCFREPNMELNAKKTDEIIEKSIIDFDDAGYLDSLRNYYYFALSELMVYFLDNSNSSSLDFVKDAVLEFYYYKIEQENMIDNNISVGVYTQADDDLLNRSQIINAEKNAQLADEEFVKYINDWSKVSRTDNV